MESDATVKVTPTRVQIMMGVGCAENGVATAEALSSFLGLDLTAVLEDLDALIRAAIVCPSDDDAYFVLSALGRELFTAICDFTKLAAEKDDAEV